MGGFGKRLLIGGLIVLAVMMTVGQIGRAFGPRWGGGPANWGGRYEQQAPSFAQRGQGQQFNEHDGFGRGFNQGQEARGAHGFGHGPGPRGDHGFGPGHHGFGPGKFLFFWLFGWPTRVALLALLGALLWRAWTTRNTDTPPSPPSGTQTV